MSLLSNLPEEICFAKYDPKFLEKNVSKPSSTAGVRIPCLGPNCDHSANFDWMCRTCQSPIQYCNSNQYIYCECGCCPYEAWSFWCTSSTHGPGQFVGVNSFALADALNALEPVDELNILILGRTGVGKSTWINAFLNYLVHSSLEDALCDSDKLSFIIPFAFRTHNLNEEGEFEDVKVSFGFDTPRCVSPNDDQTADFASTRGALHVPTGRQRLCSVTSKPLIPAGDQKAPIEEHDGTDGGSATQRTTVHRLQIGKQVVRLFDTPGIGDTRGAAKDKENLADILSVLRNYKQLHGILLLLKPNEPRLDLMFKFCVQELLTHLHRNAARNIAFGFTNTRGTNYLPGESFGPLRELLGRFEDVSISLRRDNVYCFDSESFRFLAEHKGRDDGPDDKAFRNFEENQASWDYSVTESKRLLDHFRAVPPHQVTSTVNLYETRHRIVGLTLPMAAIVETIRSTIALNNEDIQELSKNELQKKDLQKLLRVVVKTLTMAKVDLPRTTCSHEDCVEHDSTGVEGIDGKNVLRTVYKSLCHSPCHLDKVKLDEIGNERLRQCAAMSGTEYCVMCGHHWMSHLHIDYAIQEGTKETNDASVEASLKRNATFRQKREASVAAKKRLITELEGELGMIRLAAAQFSSFLKRNAIMPYNDATLEYLDRHIDEERAKVAADGSRDKLKNLLDYRNEYQQQVQLLDDYMEKGKGYLLLSQEGVNSLMKDIYNLKHYGQNLGGLSKVFSPSKATNRREKPHVMPGRAKSYWNEDKRNVVGRDGGVASSQSSELVSGNDDGDDQTMALGVLASMRSYIGSRVSRFFKLEW